MLNKAMMLVSTGVNFYDIHVDIQYAYGVSHPHEIEFFMKIENNSGFYEDFSTSFTTDESGYATLALPDWSKYNAEDAHYWVLMSSTTVDSQNYGTYYEKEYPFKKGEVFEFWLYDNS